MFTNRSSLPSQIFEVALWTWERDATSFRQPWDAIWISSMLSDISTFNWSIYQHSENQFNENMRIADWPTQSIPADETDSSRRLSHNQIQHWKLTKQNDSTSMNENGKEFINIPQKLTYNHPCQSNEFQSCQQTCAVSAHMQQANLVIGHRAVFRRLELVGGILSQSLLQALSLLTFCFDPWQQAGYGWIFLFMVVACCSWCI